MFDDITSLNAYNGIISVYVGGTNVIFCGASVGGKDTKGNALLKQATTIVVDAVRATFQTYVESLKNSGSFNKDAQLVALNKAKDTVLSQLTTEVKDYITNNFGDLNNWITNQIESSINLLKNS